MIVKVLLWNYDDNGFVNIYIYGLVYVVRVGGGPSLWQNNGLR